MALSFFTFSLPISFFLFLALSRRLTTKALTCSEGCVQTCWRWTRGTLRGVFSECSARTLFKVQVPHLMQVAGMKQVAPFSCGGDENEILNSDF